MPNQRGWDHRIAMAVGWTFGVVVLSAAIDLFASTPARSHAGAWGMSLLFVMAGLYAGFATAALKLSGYPGLRAVSIVSFVVAGALFPCVVRMVDAPLGSDSPGSSSGLYGQPGLLVIGVLTFGAILTLHTVFQRRRTTEPSISKLSLRPNYVLLGKAVLAAVVAAPLIVSSLRYPGVGEVDEPVLHAHISVPDLSSTPDEELLLFEDETVVVSAVRTHPLPKKVARLTVDLRDGVGTRPVEHVAVGGGEQLQLRRAGLNWELCNAPMHRAMSLKAAKCVTLGRFVRGHASVPAGLKVSAVRGQFAPTQALLTLTFAALIVTLLLLGTDEVDRRRVIKIAAGRQAVLHWNGVVQSEGNDYTLTSTAHHRPGPLVLFGTSDEVDPYRGRRVASSAVPGTIEQHVRRFHQERLERRAIFGVGYVLALLPALAAGVVGHWGF